MLKLGALLVAERDLIWSAPAARAVLPPEEVAQVKAIACNPPVPRAKNLTLLHLPTHASWLNQIEIYFSIIQREVVTPTTSPASTSSPGP